MLHLFSVLGSEVRGDVMLQTGNSLLDNGPRTIRWVGTCLLTVGSAGPDLWSPALPVSTAAASRQGLVPFTPMGGCRNLSHPLL